MKIKIFTLLFFISFQNLAAQADEVLGAGGSFNQKYQARKTERFDIISFLTNQKKTISAQNARYGSSGGKGFHINPDLALTYLYEPSVLTRDSAALGKAETSLVRGQFLMNDFISEGGTRRLINIDLGLEAYYLQTQHFAIDKTSTQIDFKTAESGAAILIRPFGRSSQDTGLMLKAGYLNMAETGLWTSTNSSVRSLANFYYGAEAKLYLLPFLGVLGEYDLSASQNDSSIGGTWSMTRSRIGGFIEFHLLAIGAMVTTANYKLAPTSGVEINDVDKGVSFFASVFF
jgi:hypothetical protein